MKRKITAIMAADVAEYSRLVSEDEEETLTRFGSYREVFDDFVHRAGGRIFNTAGDAVMCEFASAVEALRAAIDIQEALRTRNMAFPAERQMHFRIGISIGDVVEREGDLLGDGVNIAARLEGLAPPGGICVSRTVHEAVTNKVAVSFRDLGSCDVKNIPHPVHAYQIDIAARGAAGRVLRPELAGDGPSRAPHKGLYIGVAAAALVVAGGLALVLTRSTPPTPAPVVADAPKAKDEANSAEPGKSSLVVTENLTPAQAFEKLAKSGGLVKDAKSAPELYHNARSYEARGESAAARQAYAQLAALGGDWLDPVLRYAALLRAQDGRAGAREIFADLTRNETARAARLVHAMNFDGDERVSRLRAFIDANADYAPAAMMLADEFSEDRRNGQTLAEKRMEREALGQFLDAEKTGRLAGFFLDQSVLAQWIDGAQKRLQRLDGVLSSDAARPNISYMRAGSGWMATVTVPEPASEISYLLPGMAAPRPTGQLQMVDQRTGRPMANPMFEMPGNQKAIDIAIRYRDKNGVETGPVTFAFDPAVALVRGQRQILEQTRNAWLAFGKDNFSRLLYFTHLVSWRCGLEKAEIGFGDEEITRPLPIPPCDAANPFVIPSSMRPYFEMPAGVKRVRVRLTYAGGETSEPVSFERE